MENNLDVFINSLDTSPLKKRKEMKTKTFFLAFATAAAFFLPYIFLGHGYFIFYGDFNVQQIPFYQMCHRMIREGSIFWNWETDLGVNFIGSYSFYLLGSPFFWLTIPFPEWMLPYMMGPLLILKFACAALTGYMYIRRFTKTPLAASLGGLLYAFSGFSVYNIFFNHFHEAIISFPLLLLAVELFIAENRRGPVLLAVFFCAFTNYFFFFGMVIFVIIYWFVRVLTGRWRLSVKRFLWLMFECVVGVCLAAVILLPSFFAVIQNTRLDSYLYGWSAIMHPRGQMYLNILEIFFFPPDIPARPIFFPNADVKWSSLGGWLPIFGLVGALTWMHSNKKHWINKLIWICLFMALVPILNSSFVMFNTAYYARWFYMPILILCLATVMACEDRAANWKPSFNWVFAITAVTTLVFGLFPSGKDENGNFNVFGLYTGSNPEDSNHETFSMRFWVTCAIAIVGLIVLKILLGYIKENREKFFKASIAMVCVMSVIYSAFFIGCGVSHSYDFDDVMIPQLIEGEVTLPGDKDNYRIDVYDGVDNTGMYLGYNCINAFHSIVPGSVTEFYNYIGQDRGVASRPTTAAYAIRSLLSVKYLLNSNQVDPFMSSEGDTKMPGFKYYDEIGGYHVFENQYYIPYGFTYDYFITTQECDEYQKDARASLMLKAIVLSPEQVVEYGKYMRFLGTDYNLHSEYTEGKQNIVTSYSEYIKDCNARKVNSSYYFDIDNNGFTSKIKMDSANLVFFSVPYEEGWTAYVNGVETKIEKVNIGFMAVLAPQGDCEIRFVYETPGLEMGCYITVGAVFVAAAYILICFILRRNNPDKWVVSYPEGDELLARFEEYDKEDNLNALEEHTDEIDEYYKSLNIHNDDDSSSMFEGGFTVDTTILDKKQSDNSSEE